MRRLAWMLLALFAFAPDARAQPLIADLSSHQIAITAGFAGTELLLFGATEGEGDVVVLVRGPESDARVRRKARVAGIWINRDEMRFAGAPAFYRVAASKPLAELVPQAVRLRHQIGTDALRLMPLGLQGGADASADEIALFRQGFVRNKEAQKLYDAEIGRVAFLGPRLFRTRIQFPANVPTGAYSVEVLLVRQGQVVAAQTTPMFVNKVGIGADIYDFAHDRAAIYGLIAIFLAVFAGWAAGAVFRK